MDEGNQGKQKFNSARDFFCNVRDGFRFVLNKKAIYCVLIVTFFGNSIVAPVDTLAPAYFVQENLASFGYAAFMTGIAAGGILGTWLLTKLQKRFSKEKLFAFGFFLGAVGLMLLYFPNTVSICASSVLTGASFGFVSVLNATILQMESSVEMTARVFSIFKCISFVASPLGIFAAGLLGEFISMATIFAILGALMLINSILTLGIVKKSDIAKNEG